MFINKKQVICLSVFAWMILLSYQACAQLNINKKSYSFSNFGSDGNESERDGGHDLVFGTNALERMRILKNGNVGIGTHAPIYKLQVTGDIYADGGWVRVLGTNGLHFESYGGGLYMTDNTWIRTYGNKSFYHNTGIMRTDGQLHVGESGNRFMVSTSGHVGIGTTAPNAPLQLGNSLSNRKIVFWEDGNNDHQFYGFGMNNSLLRYQTSNTGADHAFFAGNGTSSSIELMRIKGNGNVGIGTTSPAYKLQVEGNTYLNGATSIGSNMRFRNNNATDFGLIWGGYFYTGYTSRIHDDGGQGLRIGSDDHIYFQNINSNSGNFANTTLYLNTNSGNVGIGTSSPTQKLQVEGNSHFTGTMGIGTSPVSDIALKVKGSFDVKNSLDSTVFHVSAGKQLVFVGANAYNEYISSGGASGASVIQSGNFSLWVSKGIVSEDLALVDLTDWSDFVFDKDYKLRSLQEVAAYITAHGHLPEMPSETEVKAQGYSVHDINKKLLQKIEELTLYAIQQEGKVKEQAAQLEVQQKQFNNLEQRIKQLENKQ